MVTSMIAAALAFTLCTPEIASHSIVRRMECQRALEKGLDGHLLDFHINIKPVNPELPAHRYSEGLHFT